MVFERERVRERERFRARARARARWLKRCAIYVVSAVILLASTACEEKAKPAVSGITPDQLPTQESWNSSVTFSDSGRVRAVLKAGHIRMFEASEETLLDSNLVVGTAAGLRF